MNRKRFHHRAKPNSAKPNSAKPSPLAVVALRQPAHDPPRGRVASLQPNRRDRKGSLLVVVLVCLGLIGALIFAALQGMLEQRRQLGRELQMEQTRWLAEAALAQGLKRFKAEPENKKPLLLHPEFARGVESEAKIEFIQQDDKTVAQATAWIGMKDRPELRTRIILTKKVENSSGE